MIDDENNEKIVYYQCPICNELFPPTRERSAGGYCFRTPACNGVKAENIFQIMNRIIEKFREEVKDL